MVSGKVPAAAVAGTAATARSRSRTSSRRGCVSLEIIGSPPVAAARNGPNLVEPASIGIRRR
jgi:hypothetical protein